MAINIEQDINSVNIIKKLTDEQKSKITSDLIQGVDADEASRYNWLKDNQDYLKMALQVKENKSFPWENAANVKYPLLTVASLQFQARAYGTLVNPKNMVVSRIVGYDPTGEKTKKGERISKHMTYQLMDKIENWDNDMDRLLLILPICGTVFKKVYYSSRNEQECIDLVLPQDLIVDYWCKDIKKARRLTHVFQLFHDEVTAKQVEGLYDDEVKLSLPGVKQRTPDEDKLQKRTAPGNTPEDTPHILYEIHTGLDLDEDGIKEPYIVTIEKDQQKLLRIVPNFTMDSVKKNAKGKIIEIKPRGYFVKYGFIPSPDGGFYDVGFGLLLGNLNDTASTLINQLLDSGTFATTAGGFLTKSIKLKGGKVGFSPNEWKQVSFTGDDIKKHVLPLPVREPSDVLFNLLSFIDQKGGQIISISEISTGKLPGQNTPATTTLTSVEEGLKLFTSIYKRVYRALKSELRYLYRINKEYLSDEEYFSILDGDGTMQGGQVSAADYDDDIDVIPVADPNSGSEALRLIKAQQVVELIPLGAVDPAKAGQRILEAMDIPNYQELTPQPQQDPKMMQVQAKMQADQQKSEMDMQMQQQKMQFEFIEKIMDIKFKQFELGLDAQAKQQDMQFKQLQSMLDMKVSAAQSQQDMALSEQQHAFDMESGADNLKLQKEKNDMKRKEMKSGSGSKSKSKQGRIA